MTVVQLRVIPSYYAYELVMIVVMLHLDSESKQ